ncbi:helix-turn-helix domain-containing protein [Neisseria sp. P0019.S002]|jgi:DNA-binding helix-turn-helix protein|uniref:helix-turn-helix domain-containing protein n=1 Tax=Neisseria sp. P0019.S002 TaxID=3436798 RepID=UPI003F806B64
MNMPILNQLFSRFDFRKKHNRMDLNIQAVDLLRQALESKNITRTEIAQKLGISIQAVSKTLSLSEKNLELNTIADIATALDMQFSLELVDDPHCVSVTVATNQEKLSYKVDRTSLEYSKFFVKDGVSISSDSASSCCKSSFELEPA